MSSNKILTFPNYKLGDIPACLRKLADHLEAGDIEATHAVVVLSHPDHNVEVKGFGSEPFTLGMASGLLTGAQFSLWLKEWHDDG